jgi:signal transduction histidine kinase
MIRVFNNLLKNAIQAIEIEEDGLIEVQISKENEMIQIAVRDNGNGIDDELQEKIFSPNFTTKTSGMGLGLAMVKNIINSHGGTIWFESEIQKGTTFFFTLPIVENVA